MTIPTRAVTASGFAGAWQQIRPVLWTHRASLAAGLLFLLIGRAMSFVLPYVSKLVVDDVIVNEHWETLPRLAGAVAIATLVDAAASFATLRLLSNTGHGAAADLRSRVASQIVRLPISTLDAMKTGGLITRIMTDADAIRSLVGLAVPIGNAAAMTATALAVLCYLNWQLTVLTVFELAMLAVGLHLSLRRVRPLIRYRGVLLGEMTSRLAECLDGIRVVKAYATEPSESAILAQGFSRIRDNEQRMALTGAVLSALTAIGVGLLGISIAAVGALAIRAGTMTIGDFVMYLATLALLVGPISQSVHSGTQLTDALASIERVHEIRLLRTEETDDLGRRPLADVRGAIAFHDVSFGYGTGEPVIRQLSFESPAGSTTALVGVSGSGKSTVINLLMGFHEPRSGTITVDGHDLTQVRASDYRKHLGVVLQSDFVFDGTIAENISYASPGATPTQIEKAGDLAHCTEFIARLADGYQTIVGTRGVRLSGGQRQRLAIARAILANPRILILDEATSNLDSESEALIRDSLQALRRGRTTFVIAHRLSTIQDAHQILVLDRGRLVQRGTHADLLRQRGRYRDLYERQFRTGRETGPTEPEAQPDLIGATAGGNLDRRNI